MEGLDFEIIVVGAGVAGLAAGRSLTSAGRSVAVLDARKRVGGRVLTVHVPDAGGTRAIAVELGAEFVHGLPQESWTLMREAHLPVYEIMGAHTRFARGRFEATGAEDDDSGDVLQRMLDWSMLRPRGEDSTFTGFLEAAGINGQTARRAVRYVEGFNAADSNLISVASLAKQQRAEDSIQSDRLFRLGNGYQELPAYLAAGLERAGGRLLLDRIAQRIEWRRGLVIIHGRDGGGREFRLRAHRAVITVPLGVLQADSIEFAPEPGEILVHARRMAMGSVVRVTLVFKSRFWRDQQPHLDDLSFLFADDELPGTWWTAAPDPTPIITGWVGGASNVAAIKARVEAHGGADALLVLCLETLARVFDLEVARLQQMLIGWHTHDWQLDEFARGAYSYVPVGALDASDRMAEPVEDTLYFAGEHTDTTGHWGTVHGALRSGLRAADQIRATSAADRLRDA